MTTDNTPLTWNPLPFSAVADRGALLAALEIANNQRGTMQTQRIWLEKSDHPKLPVRIIACNALILIVINSPGKVEGLTKEGTELFEGDYPEPYFVDSKNLIDLKMSKSKPKLKWRAKIEQNDKGEIRFYDEVTNKTTLIQTHNPKYPKPLPLNWRRILPAPAPEMSFQRVCLNRKFSAEKDKFEAISKTASLLRSAALEIDTIRETETLQFIKIRMIPHLPSDPHASMLFASTGNTSFVFTQDENYPF